MRSSSFFLKKLKITSWPKTKLTPLSDSPHILTLASGSAQRRSQRRPVSGISVGRTMELIWSTESRSGERPPCIHSILSSMRAATGMQLKQSTKDFHNFTLNLLLPELQNFYIIRRNHRYGWLMLINDYLLRCWSFLDTLSWMQIVSKLFKFPVFLYQHSLQGTSNWIMGENHRTKIV